MNVARHSDSTVLIRYLRQRFSEPQSVFIGKYYPTFLAFMEIVSLILISSF